MITNFVIGVVLWIVVEIIRDKYFGWKISSIKEHIMFTVLVVFIIASASFTSKAIDEFKSNYVTTQNK